MNYAEILSRRLKKAGRDFAKGQAVDKKSSCRPFYVKSCRKGRIQERSFHGPRRSVD